MRHASSDHAPDSEPRILPLVPPAGLRVRDLLDSIVADRPAPAAVRLDLDVPAEIRVTADAAAFRAAVERLVASAFVAATAATHGDGPPIHEVVVTAIDGPDAFELEIADSAPSGSFDARCPAIVRDLVDRCGGTLGVADCAEGGTAVTIRLPRRAARRQAA